MKSKIGLIAVVIFSGLVLSACTNKETTNTGIDNSANGTQVEKGANSPSGTPNNRDPGQQMDLAAAAKTLGVTEEELRTALGINNETEQISTTPGTKPSGQPKQMDLAAAAKTLGVTEEALKEAMGMNNMPSGGARGERPEGSPPATKN